MIVRVLLAVAIGLMVTMSLMGMASVAADAGYEFLARSLTWQNSLLQSLVPTGNMGTPEHPFQEGTPLNLIAFVLSVPAGVVAYGTLAFLLMKRRDRWGKKSRDSL